MNLASLLGIRGGSVVGVLVVAGLGAGSLTLPAAAGTIDYDLAALLGNNGYRFFATGSGNNVGFRVASLGDVNSDGYDDFLTSGLPSSLNPNVHLVFGKPGLGQTGSLDFTSVTVPWGWRITGPFGDDYGEALAGIGDFNGDGFGDFAIGAQSMDGPGGKTEAGRVFVVFGKTTYGATQTQAIGTFIAAHGFQVVGANASDRLGASVAGAGDLNGDNYADLIIGAPNVTVAGLQQAGVAYVLFGGPAYAVNSVIDAGTLTPANSITLLGSASTQAVGRSSAGVGDLDVDGTADAVVGAPGTDATGNAGKVYGIFGGNSGGPIDTANPLTGVGFVVSGSLAGDMMGYKVAGLGDFNGDGPPDFAMTLPFADDNGTNAGAAAIMYGAPNVAATGFAFVNNFTGAQGARILGIAGSGQFGFALCGPGDMNGDGRADVVIADPSGDPAGVANAGRVYLVRGAPAIGGTGVFDLTNLDNGVNGTAFAGILPQDSIGIDVSGGGDVNNDGLPDLLIASKNAQNLPGGHIGEIYVIQSLTPPPLTVDVHQLFATTGGVQKLSVQAGSVHAGRYYYILGSMSGTAPGVTLGGFPLALVADSYFQFMLSYPNLIVANSLGILDAQGRGEGTLVIPPNVPSPFQNITLYHAYFVYDATVGKVKATSNTVNLRLKP